VTGSPTNTVAWVEAYLHTKWHLDPSIHLATADMDRKLGACATLGEGELGPHLTRCGQGRGLPACQVSSGSVQPFGHNTPTLQTGQERQRSHSIGRIVLQTVAQKVKTTGSYLLKIYNLAVQAADVYRGTFVTS